MFKRALKKPDGREMILYSLSPIDPGIVATSPNPTRVPPTPHLRWHPLRGEWVAYAGYRQGRVYLPANEANPLAVTSDPQSPTELPLGAYDMAVFENLSPALLMGAPPAPKSIVPTQPGDGVCEVVVYSQSPDTSLGRLPLDQIELLLDVWIDRTRDLGSRPGIQYVMPFENRGVEMGVTLHHPHGQVYAYSHVPPVPRREHENELTHFEKNGRTLLECHVERELDEPSRLLFPGRDIVAFVPAFARYPYETWIAPRRPRAYLGDLTPDERRELARALKTVLLKFDGLWNRPFPYLLVVHQAPTDEAKHPESHCHIEIYPPYRTRDRLKFLAGTELGAGMFANDSLPEEKAAELRAVEVTV